MIRVVVLLALAAPASAAEIHRLSPAEIEAARADGESRAVEMFAREDAAARKKRFSGQIGIGIGGGARAFDRGHAPLGDVGQTGFVFPDVSPGRWRYRD